MYVARVLYPIEVLGPGKRVGIWFCGCPRRCKGCSNPELWDFQERYKTTPETVFEMIKSVSLNHTIDGFTIAPIFCYEDIDNVIVPKERDDHAVPYKLVKDNELFVETEELEKEYYDFKHRIISKFDEEYRKSHE